MTAYIVFPFPDSVYLHKQQAPLLAGTPGHDKTTPHSRNSRQEKLHSTFTKICSEFCQEGRKEGNVLLNNALNTIMAIQH